MKSRYAALVRFKKNRMLEVQKLFLEAKERVEYWNKELSKAYAALDFSPSASSGDMRLFLQWREQTRMQHRVIQRLQESLQEAQRYLQEVQVRLKEATMEYEKFHFLELEEIKQLLKASRLKEQKALDEMAVQSFLRGREDDL